MVNVGCETLMPCDPPTEPLRSTGRSRSTYWALLPYGFQQLLITPLAPRQGGTKPDRRYNHAMWFLVDLWAALSWVWPTPLSIFLGCSGHVAEPTSLVSLYSKKCFDIQGFSNFTAAHFVAKCRAVKSSQQPHLCPCTWDSTNCRQYPIFMAIAKNRNKDWLKFESFVVFVSSLYLWSRNDETHIILCLIYQCVYQSPCSAFLTREYQPKVLVLISDNLFLHKMIIIQKFLHCKLHHFCPNFYSLFAMRYLEKEPSSSEAILVVESYTSPTATWNKKSATKIFFVKLFCVFCF